MSIVSSGQITITDLSDGKNGVDGKDGIAGKDGVGVKTTVISYTISTSGTTAPSTSWTSSVPSLVKGQYLWTKTVWTYTDNSSETGYTVSYISKDGNNGHDGIAGKDGNGIKTTTITYASHTNGTTAPTTGYTTTVPSVPAGQFLWTKTVWTYTDNTIETGYSVAKMGLKGDKGDPGTKGSDGTSGIIVSSVAPASPQTGQLWQDTSTTPQLVKKWTGSSWVIWEFYAQNLKSDSLETVSSKIGNIYNDFTLEDGTTGTLHIGNSEYRINSQVLKDNFLFKENIFFDPDGVNFTFEGDSTSNSGYGNYSKSGSDFYLQNNQMASYTASGIRMSNEFAGYSIKIHDANHKLNFISKNGQGFDFTGPVSFNGVPMNTASSITVALNYGISVNLTRIGNVVHANFPKQIKTVSAKGENEKILEKLPAGFRPSYRTEFGVNINSSATVYPQILYSFNEFGEVFVTNNYIGTGVFAGSTMYFTDDAMPV